MREIVFRGKTLSNSEWVYGYLFKIWERSYIMRGTTNDIPNSIEVDTKTCSQYTGLEDIYDNKIYEGDIGRHKTSPREVVEFKDGAFRIGKHTLLNRIESFEVIGNIYDNFNLSEVAINDDSSSLRRIEINERCDKGSTDGVCMACPALGTSQCIG